MLNNVIPGVTLANPQQAAMDWASRMCTWNDDLVFDVGSAGERRTRLEYLGWNTTTNTASVSPYPYLANADTNNVFSNANNPRVQTASQGNYSWMLTARPAPGRSSPRAANVSGASPDHYVYAISVVVFYHRDLSTSTAPATSKPAEGVVTNLTLSNNFLSAGLSGGDVKLTVPIATDPEYLSVNTNDWVMLFSYPSAAGGASGVVMNMARWYRVVSAGDALPTRATRTGCGTLRWQVRTFRPGRRT